MVGVVVEVAGRDLRTYLKVQLLAHGYTSEAR
jgi:hypothetical protein